MAIAAESSSPTGPLSDADCWLCISDAVALETRVTAAAATAATTATDSIIIAVDAAAVNATNITVAVPLAAVAGNNDDNARTMLKRASVISSATKISLHGIF